MPSIYLSEWSEYDRSVNENFILDVTSVISDYHDYKLDCAQTLESLLSIYEAYKQKVDLQKEEVGENGHKDNPDMYKP